MAPESTTQVQQEAAAWLERDAIVDRRGRRRSAAIAVLCLLLITFGGKAIVDENEDDIADAVAAGTARGDATRERVSTLEGSNAELQVNYAKLYAQFEKCKDEEPSAEGCEEPAVPAVTDLPSTDPTVLPPTIIRQVETLPETEVRQAVRRVCGGSCEGQDVTADMVADGIVAYCEANGCRGGDGESITGPSGPPPTDAQVLAGVAAYCSANDCTGAPGPTCPDGYTGGVLQVMTSLTESTEIFGCVADAPAPTDP